MSKPASASASAQARPMPRAGDEGFQEAAWSRA
jgi:hypothetical protein